MKRIHSIYLVVLSVCLAGCATPENAAHSRLAQLLKANGYTLYTPIRAGDYPGTIFVFARNTERETIELTLSPWAQTFQADTGDLFPPDGQAVNIGQKIIGTNSF